MKTPQLGFIAIIAVLSGSALWAGQPGTVAGQSKATETKLFHVAELTTKPKPTKMVQPLYPAQLKAARITGEALVSFVVDVDGSVKNTQIEKASDPAFGEAAIKAVSAWEFEPGYKDGTPVACRLILPLRFAIKD